MKLFYKREIQNSMLKVDKINKTNKVNKSIKLKNR